jgi:hypothetical protein
MQNERLLAYLAYFEHLAQQPQNRWEGFALDRNEDRQFGLRFQIALACYALGSLSLHPQMAPPEQERCRVAMASLIERMLQRRVWAYWSLAAERRGSDPDPLRRANASYSSHLAMMIGLFEAVGGDGRFDEPFTLFWNSQEQFEYTHSSLVETIVNQLAPPTHHGLERWTGRVHLVDMGAVLWATTLHDIVHNSVYATKTRPWLEVLQRRMVRRGPRLGQRSIFRAISVAPPFLQTHIPLPFGLRFADAWMLSCLAVLEPDLASQLAPALFRRVRRIRRPRGKQETEPVKPQAFLPSASLYRSHELAAPPSTTALTYLLAVQMGETSLAAELLAYADAHFAPTEQDGRRFYQAGLAPVCTTAIIALGEAGGFLPLQEQVGRLADTGSETRETGEGQEASSETSETNEEQEEEQEEGRDNAGEFAIL